MREGQGQRRPGSGVRGAGGGRVVQMAYTIKGEMWRASGGQTIDRLMDSTSGPQH